MSRASADTRKSQIVRAAMELLNDGGLSAMTTTAVAERVGIAQATVFKHFPVKADIILGIFAVLGARIDPLEDEAFAMVAPAAERLRRMVCAPLVAFRDLPPMPPALFSKEILTEIPAIHDVHMARRARIDGMMGAIVADGIASGEFAPDLDVMTAVHAVMGLVVSALNRRQFEGLGYDFAAEAAAMIDLLLNGLRRR